MPEKYCKKEFLTPDDEPSTSAVVSWYGDIKWDKDNDGGNVSFLEISSCHEVVRLHRTYEMTHEAWVAQVQKLKNHIDEYLIFLESVADEEPKEKISSGTFPYTEAEIIHMMNEIELGHTTTDQITWNLEIFSSGRTIAHEAARLGKLPNDFGKSYPELWRLECEFDKTVAHEAAGSGKLPENFGKEDPSLWTIEDISGWTVAHEAAKARCLPSYFGKDDPSLWDTATRQGETVKEIYDLYKEKESSMAEVIRMPDEIPSGVSTAWIKPNNSEVKLPNIFPKIPIK